jgi:hypothetical protein
MAEASGVKCSTAKALAKINKNINHPSGFSTNRAKAIRKIIFNRDLAKAGF